MSSQLPQDASNCTLPAFAFDKGGAWSINTTISLIGVVITGVPVIFLLWKKCRDMVSFCQRLQCPQQEHPSPDSVSEMEMGCSSTALPEPSATAPSETSGHHRADFESPLANNNNSKNNQDATKNTTYPTQLDADEIQIMQNATSPSEIRTDALRAAMWRRASFHTEIVHSTVGEEQGWTSQTSEDTSALLRRDTAP